MWREEKNNIIQFAKEQWKLLLVVFTIMTIIHYYA
jgi:hypothetical protein